MIVVRELDLSHLKAIIRYDESTGLFTWIKGRQRVASGSAAGCITGNGYCSITIFGRRYYAHRVAWLWFYGRWPNGQIDHIDGNRSNNSIKNLRECSQKENAQNRIGVNKTSSHIGVSWDDENKKWRAQIRVDGIGKKYLGLFDDEVDAANAYINAKAKLHTFNPTIRQER